MWYGQSHNAHNLAGGGYRPLQITNVYTRSPAYKANTTAMRIPKNITRPEQFDSKYAAQTFPCLHLNSPDDISGALSEGCRTFSEI